MSQSEETVDTAATAVVVDTPTPVSHDSKSSEVLPRQEEQANQQASDLGSLSDAETEPTVGSQDPDTQKTQSVNEELVISGSQPLEESQDVTTSVSDAAEADLITSDSQKNATVNTKVPRATETVDENDEPSAKRTKRDGGDDKESSPL